MLIQEWELCISFLIKQRFKSYPFEAVTGIHNFQTIFCYLYIQILPKLRHGSKLMAKIKTWCDLSQELFSVIFWNWRLSGGDWGAILLRKGHSSNIGDKNFVLCVIGTQNFLPEVARYLRRKRVSSSEISQPVVADGESSCGGAASILGGDEWEVGRVRCEKEGVVGWGFRERNWGWKE